MKGNANSEYIQIVSKTHEKDYYVTRIVVSMNDK